MTNLLKILTCRKNLADCDMAIKKHSHSIMSGAEIYLYYKCGDFECFILMTIVFDLVVCLYACLLLLYFIYILFCFCVSIFRGNKVLLLWIILVSLSPVWLPKPKTTCKHLIQDITFFYFMIPLTIRLVHNSLKLLYCQCDFAISVHRQFSVTCFLFLFCVTLKRRVKF